MPNPPKIAATEEPSSKLEIPGAEPAAPISPELEAALDDDEREFRRLRRDLPGVQGVAAQGIVAISVSKAPTKNEFFRTHPTFRPIVSLVNVEVGMDRHYFAIDAGMEVPLRGIGITCAEHTLFLTVSPRGAVHIIPVNCASENEFSRTKEISLLDGIERWVRLFTDQEDKMYRVFPAPEGRFSDPIWPPLSEARIFRLGFRDKGRLIDSTEHPLFKKWAARDH